MDIKQPMAIQDILYHEYGTRWFNPSLKFTQIITCRGVSFMSLACTCRNPVCGIDRHSVSCVAHIIVFAALGVIVQDMVQSLLNPFCWVVLILIALSTKQLWIKKSVLSVYTLSLPLENPVSMKYSIYTFLCNFFNIALTIVCRVIRYTT